MSEILLQKKHTPRLYSFLLSRRQSFARFSAHQHHKLGTYFNTSRLSLLTRVFYYIRSRVYAMHVDARMQLHYLIRALQPKLNYLLLFIYYIFFLLLFDIFVGSHTALRPKPEGREFDSPRCHCLNPSGRTVISREIQLLREMSTRKVKVAGAQDRQTCHLHARIFYKFLKPQHLARLRTC